MKKTLLRMVQDILDSLDGEEINSISDTTESKQIVTFIRNSYEVLYDSLDLPNTYTLCQLNSATDINIPVVLYLPDNVSKIAWIKYEGSDIVNTEPRYQSVEYMNVEDFLERMYGTSLQDDYVVKSRLNLSSGIFDIFYKIDKSPTYYTVLEDKVLLFDSYDASVDTTLHSSKTVCYGEIIPEFREEDNFIPNLDDKQFTLLENEAKAQAFAEQKQDQNPIATQRARKGWIRSQRTKTSVPIKQNYQLNSTTNYGRYGNGYITNSRRLKNGW